MIGNLLKHDSVVSQYRKRSQFGEVWQRFKKNKGALISLILLLILFAVAATIDLWVDKDLYVMQNIRESFQGPSSAHWFGTDELGRDLFWRVLYGSRYSLSIGFVSVAVALAIGATFGAIAGYYGGTVETIIMRIADVFSAIPNILMAVVIVSVLGANMFNLILALGLSSVPGFIRITRAAVITVRGQEYIEASRALGKSTAFIIFKDVLPNCLSPIIVEVTLSIASAVVSASSLSYLGLGIKPPAPEWGALLSSGKAYVRTASYLTLFPGLAVMLTVLMFNLVGDGLRDALDPKLK